MLIHYHIFQNGGATIASTLEREFPNGFATVHGPDDVSVLDQASRADFISNRAAIQVLPAGIIHSAFSTTFWAAPHLVSNIQVTMLALLHAAGASLAERQERLKHSWGADLYATLARLNQCDLELCRRSKREITRRFELVPGAEQRMAEFQARCPQGQARTRNSRFHFA